MARTPDSEEIQVLAQLVTAVAVPIRDGLVEVAKNFTRHFDNTAPYVESFKETQLKVAKIEAATSLLKSTESLSELTEVQEAASTYLLKIFAE